MSEDSAEPPGAVLRRAIRSSWNTMLTVYYANSLSWRILKAGALVFLGFFAWAGSSILLSYRPGWTVLHYPQAYGFVLLLFGPFHHLVIIPVYQRLRRQGTHLTLGGHLHLPNVSLGVFLAIVLLLGTFPAGPMTIDFTATLDDAGVDIDPALLCVKGSHENGTDIHCHLSASRGIDRVVVQTGGDTLLTDSDPPFDFTIQAAQLERETVGERFTVDLLDEDGGLIRRYTRTLSMIQSE